MALKAVVLGRIVGRGDHDTRVTVVVTGRETEGRNGHKRIVNADVDAVACQNAGGLFGEDITLQTAVVSDGDGLVAALGLDPVGNALRSLADYPDIHAVRAGAQCAAQSRGTELQRNGKALFDRVVVIGNDLHLLSFKNSSYWCTIN